MRMLHAFAGFSAIASLMSAALDKPHPISTTHRTGSGCKSVSSRARQSRTKWTGAQLRAIRARNGVGRPPVKG